ncbi:MAG TPA: ferredoxin, partial [Desulfobacteraceae bacterium]|nr:ferredoxin [Desulfobacteraceae bacterium]
MDLLTGDKLSVKSTMNAQIPFGDDVISRISFCQEKSGGLEKLRTSIVQCLNTLIMEASKEAEI